MSRAQVVWRFECMHLIPLIKCCRWRLAFLPPPDDCGDAIKEKGKLSYVLQTVWDDRYWKKSPLNLPPVQTVSYSIYYLIPSETAFLLLHAHTSYG